MKFIVPLSIGLFLIDSGLIIFAALLAGLGAPTGWLSGIISSSAYSFLGNFTPLINSLLLTSFGWLLTKKIFNKEMLEADIYGLRRLGLSILAGVVFVPVIFAPTMLFPYIVGKAFVFRFMALALVVVYALLALSNSQYRPRVTPTVLTFGILTLVMGLSTLVSIDPYKSFFGNYERMEGYITTLLIFGVLVSIFGLRLQEIEWRKLFGINVAVSLFVSGIAWIQYFSFSAFAGLPILGQCVNKAVCQTDSTLGNSIYLGIYAALSAWLVAYAIFSKKAQSNLPILWIALIVNLGAVVFSGARGTAIGIFLGVVVAIASYLFVNESRKKFYQSLGATVVVAVVLTGSIWAANKYGVAQNIPLVAKFASSNTLFARLNVWQTAVDAWQAKPIFGWGQENFIHAFNKFYNPAMYGQETYFDHPHNTYLGWLSMGGILGFLAYLAFVCAIVWSVYYTYKREEGKQAAVGLAVALGLLTTYLFHIFFVFDSLTSTLLLVFIIGYFARGVSFGSLALPQLNKSSLRISAVGLSAVALVFTYFSWWQPIYANKLIIQGMSGSGSTVLAKIQNMHQSFNKAVALGSFGTYEAAEQMANRGLALGQLVSSVDAESAKAIVSFNQDAKANMEKQADVPFDHKAKFAYGMYLSSLGDFDGAEKYFTQALELAPKKQVAMLALAQVYTAKGENDKALALYKQAVDVTPVPNTEAGRSAYNNLRIQYIQGLMLAGKNEEAVAVIKDMLPAATRTDFQSLVGAMTAVYEKQRDLRGIVTTLVQAQQLDQKNANFVIWLARALALGGEYEASAQQIEKLRLIDPDFVNQFQQELYNLSNEEKKQTQTAPQSVATPTQATATQSVNSN